MSPFPIDFVSFTGGLGGDLLRASGEDRGVSCLDIFVETRDSAATFDFVSFTDDLGGDFIRASGDERGASVPCFIDGTESPFFNFASFPGGLNGDLLRASGKDRGASCLTSFPAGRGSPFVDFIFFVVLGGDSVRALGGEHRASVTSFVEERDSPFFNFVFFINGFGGDAFRASGVEFRVSCVSSVLEGGNSHAFSTIFASFSEGLEGDVLRASGEEANEASWFVTCSADEGRDSVSSLSSTAVAWEPGGCVLEDGDGTGEDGSLFTGRAQPSGSERRRVLAGDLLTTGSVGSTTVLRAATLGPEPGL